MEPVLEVGLSWVQIDKKNPVDLDLSCASFDETGKLVDAVYFKKKNSDDGSVHANNDSRDGKEADDDEAIYIELPKVHPAVKALVLSTSCFSKHSFKKVESGTVELRNYQSKSVIQHYDLANAGKKESVILWALYRDHHDWKIVSFQQPCHGRNFQEFKDDMRGCLTSIIDPNIMNEFKVDIKNERSFDVNKGDVVNINSMHNVVFGLGWDSKVDVDASCVLMQGDRMADVVFYGNLASKGKIVKHSGDNRTGEGDGDDERITVDLTKLMPEITSLIFTVNIFTVGHNFKQVKGLFVRLLNMDNGREMFKYTVNKEDNMNKHNAMIVCKVYRQHDSWKFMAIGSPQDGQTAHQLKDKYAHYADEGYAPKVKH